MIINTHYILLFPIIHFLIFDVSSVQSLATHCSYAPEASHLEEPKITEGTRVFKHHV